MNIYIYGIPFITALLGAMRNYAKYRTFSINYFIRTPITINIIYYMLTFHNKLYDIYFILIATIMERWFFLFIKTIISMKNDDYNKRKYKYMEKYGLMYSN